MIDDDFNGGGVGGESFVYGWSSNSGLRILAKGRVSRPRRQEKALQWKKSSKSQTAHGYPGEGWDRGSPNNKRIIVRERANGSTRRLPWMEGGEGRKGDG